MPIHSISSDLMPGKQYSSNSCFAYQAQSGLVPSIDLQFQLRELYDYLDNSRAALNEIRRYLFVAPEQPQKAIERLEEFYMDADSWQFDALYKIASGLQRFLLNSGNRAARDDYLDVLEKGFGMLSAILEQCESDFRLRLAIAEMLDIIDPEPRNPFSPYSDAGQ